MRFHFLFLQTFFLGTILLAQPQQTLSSSQIQHELNKLGNTASVLYIAAHPDDENTRMLSWLANEKKVRTAYLSLTRGDGGQNLIGPEQSEYLGLIRTQELLAARRIDKAEQFFTRAIDFGYSKSAEESFNIWNHDSILADVVWVIRKYRPDVIITRFPPTRGAGHGHHEASAILAEEAFDAAADPKRFPGQLKHVQTWQPKRLLWNASTWWNRNLPTIAAANDSFFAVDVGGYDPLLGLSYTEMAAESRSQHRSQGFGSSRVRGYAPEFLKIIKGSLPENDNIFYGIDTTWSTLNGGTETDELIEEILYNFEPAEPWGILPMLIKLHKQIAAMPQTPMVQRQQERLNTIISAAAGVYVEAVGQEYSATPGATVPVTVSVIRRGKHNVDILRISNPMGSKDQVFKQDTLLAENVVREKDYQLKVPQKLSQPYWLERQGTIGLFSQPDITYTGMPENPDQWQVQVDLMIERHKITLHRPVLYKWVDPAFGELYRPFEILPNVTLNVAERNYVFAGSEPQQVNVLVKAWDTAISGDVQLQLPKGWRAEPAQQWVSLTKKEEEKLLVFDVFPPETASTGAINAVLKTPKKVHKLSTVRIDYPHIPMQTVFPEAKAKVARLDLQRKGQNIGYIMGAGDDVPAALRQMGYDVKLLSDNELNDFDLSQFDAIVVGVRAYNTRDRLKFYQPMLMDYVSAGGNLIVQYNTSRGLITDEIGPYPLQLSRNRITVEGAPLKMLQPKHPLFNTPNLITEADFQNWVQERGLYFADEWHENYTSLLEGNDPGEDPMQGMLLVADHGEGHFIFTGLSFFRQLPAGVPGAFRLFTNMVSYGR